MEKINQNSASRIRQGIDHIKNDLHLSELLTGSSIAFILKIAGMLFSYIFILLVTRNFGAGAMGIFALSTTVLSVFSILGRLGFDTALLRFIAEYSSQGRLDMVKGVYHKALKIVIPLSIFISFILFYLSPFIAKNIFHKEYLSLYFRIVSLAVLPMVLININSQALRALKKIKEFSFFQNISNFLFASISLAVMLVFARQQSAVIVSYVLALFSGAVLSHILWQKNARLAMGRHCETLMPQGDAKGDENTPHPNPLPQGEREQNNPPPLMGGGEGEGEINAFLEQTIKLKDMLNVSLPMMLSGSMAFIMGWTATIMLGMFKSDMEVGIFNVAVKVAVFTSITLVAINSIAAPKFAEFYGKKDIEGLGKVARQSTKLIFWTSFPILLAIFLFPSFILGIFGTEFKAGIFALLILTVGQFVNAISGSVGFILQMTGKEKVFQNIMLAATALNIALNAVLIPRYGINGAAVANMVSMVFLNLSSVIYIKFSMNINTLYIPALIRR